MPIEMMEQLGVRNRCSYFLVDEQPEWGRWWAVQLIAVTPPGEMFPTTPDGVAVENLAVAGAEKQADGLWMWLSMTPAAKRVFGDLLVQQNIPPGTWAYVVEVDQQILEMVEAIGEEEAEEEEEVGA